AVNVARISAIEARIGEIDKTLKDQFPDYSALASVAVTSIADVQAVLRDDEALLMFLDTDDRFKPLPEQTFIWFKPLPEETFIWVVTKREVRWLHSDLGTQALAREVAALRCGLDATAWWSKDTVCAGLTGTSYTEADYEAGVPLPCDVGGAHALYKSLLGDAEDLIEGKHLLIVPAGALTTLPFQVRVTKPPASQDFASATWLIRDHAITVLPSVASLS